MHFPEPAGALTTKWTTKWTTKTRMPLGNLTRISVQNKGEAPHG